MKHLSKTWSTVVIFTMLLLGGIWYLYTFQPEEEEEVSGVASISEIVQQESLTPSESLERPVREVTLFVGNFATGTFVKESREIETYQGILHEMTQTIAYLIHPEPDVRNSVFPEGTELLNIFLTRAGIAYLNLSRHVQDRHVGGLSAELATVTSLVNTVLFNFKEIAQVQILVEGAEIETLAGHVDCRKPFSKMLLIDL